MHQRATITLSLCAAVAATIAVAMPEPARAFALLRHWDQDAHGEPPENEAGAGGLIGTGGPRDFGVQCAHCHIDGAGLIDLTFAAQPSFGMAGNDWTYQPGQRYDIVVTMTGTHRVVEMPNQNAIAVSFEDPGGNLMGFAASDSPGVDQSSCPSGPENQPPGTTYMVGGCGVVVSILADDATSWTFSWTAPNDGEVTMWYGGVDGDYYAESSLGDDVVQGSVRILPE